MLLVISVAVTMLCMSLCCQAIALVNDAIIYYFRLHTSYSIHTPVSHLVRKYAMCTKVMKQKLAKQLHTVKHVNKGSERKDSIIYRLNW